MELMKTVSTRFATVFVGLNFVAAGLAPAWAQEQTIHERMFHSRAVEAVVWAMPLLNFKGFRDAHAAAGVGPNDVTFHSQVQNALT